jgi:hypothetical protein
LAAFRSGFKYQSTLLRLKIGKQSLDNKESVAAILMDLSKAFYSLPHDLLLLKLKCYDLSQTATDIDMLTRLIRFL